MNKKVIGIILSIIVILIVIGVVVISLSKVPTYEVVFKFNNGIANETIEVKSNMKVESPKGPVKEGYKFLGWYLNNEKFDFSTKIVENITLNARWEKDIKSFTIAFDSLGGTTINDLIVEEGSVISEIPNPIKEGYIFKGWYYQNKEFDFNTKIEKNLTLVAKWEKDKQEKN